MTDAAPDRLRAGVFLAPFHPLDEDPTLAIRRDLQLMEHLDRIGFDEAWVGEHHSAGYEIIASPELFIAAAAERTERLRLGTGVISLPYHHPLMVADRMVQLDHMSRGRVMMGVGPGLLPSDAKMLGIPIDQQRNRMAQSLEAILRLFAGETVDEQTDWYTLRDARLQLLPYSRPRMEVAVTSTITPAGAKLAGQHGLGMLCVAASQTAGYDALGTNWSIACDVAAQAGQRMDRSQLRLVAPMHLAESREQARRDVDHGLAKWLHYFRQVNPAGGAASNTSGDPVDALNASGFAVIGTPEDAVARIEAFRAKSGGFGCILLLAHNWADFDATCRSYGLFARHVLPALNQVNAARTRSLEGYVQNKDALIGEATSAVLKTFEQHKEAVDKHRR